MPKSLKEQLEESFEQAEEQEDEEVGRPEEDEPKSLGDTSEEEETKGRAEGEIDAEEESDKESDVVDEVSKTGDEEDGEDEKPVSSKESESEGSEVSSKTSEKLRAPVSWKPGIREHWNKLPVDVQKEVLRREQDIENGLRQASSHKKIAQEYVETIKPYEGMIRASGVNPSQAINSMFSTAQTLTMGTPAQKAAAVRDIIKNYGVDIEVLDEVLSGEEIPDDHNPIVQQIEQRLKPVTDFMQEFQNQRQQVESTTQEKVAEELNNFRQNPKNEFYDDVREDMADIIEFNSRRGRDITLQQAYDQACQLNPEIKSILDQRAKAAANNTPENRRRAASSIPASGPNQTSGRKRGNSIRDSLEEAFEETQRR